MLQGNVDTVGFQAVVQMERSAFRGAWADWLTLFLGVALVVSPFILGFNEGVAAEWWDILVGVVLIVLSMFRLVAPTGTQGS